MSKQDQQHLWKLAGRYSTIGIEIAIAVTLPTIAGIWADNRFATSPWLLITGLIIGFGAATRVIIRLIRSTKL
ncbi:MAG: AtpZ/AtpI family protein [Deltaproteobacteria bacterium]|nr:AtpZ/AtpI family protein [Deltaproteobacteria bacterium]